MPGMAKAWWGGVSGEFVGWGRRGGGGGGGTHAEEGKVFAGEEEVGTFVEAEGADDGLRVFVVQVCIFGGGGAVLFLCLVYAAVAEGAHEDEIAQSCWDQEVGQHRRETRGQDERKLLREEKIMGDRRGRLCISTYSGALPIYAAPGIL